MCKMIRKVITCNAVRQITVINMFTFGCICYEDCSFDRECIFFNDHLNHISSALLVCLTAKGIILALLKEVSFKADVGV